ncbi:MAG: hypothetical protein ACOYXB_06225 [Bacteroidota bacterium]
MKRLLVATFALFLALSAFSQSSGLGVGVILGNPTGLSAKMWTSRTTAIDGAAAWAITSYGGFIHVHADMLLHPFEFDVKKGSLPFYFGVGGRVLISSDPRVGIRVPFGVAYAFEDVPFDVFFELVPILDLIPGSGFDMNAAIGIRYFLE